MIGPEHSARVLVDRPSDGLGLGRQTELAVGVADGRAQPQADLGPGLELGIDGPQRAL